MIDTITARVQASGLKPGHILVILVFSVFAMELVIRLGFDAGWWPRIGRHRELLVLIGATGIGTGMFACIPELRKAMIEMFRFPVIPIRLTDLLLSLALGYAWCLGIHKVAIVMPTMWFDANYFFEFWGYQESSRSWSLGNWILLAVSMGFLTPILEELFFRGMLLNSWLVRRTVATSVLLSSLAFGLVHGRSTVLAFGFGVIAALLFLGYRSLWPGIALHGIYNVLQITPGLISLTQVKTLSEVTTWRAWFVEMALAIAFIPLAVLFWRRFKPQ